MIIHYRIAFCKTQHYSSASELVKFFLSIIPDACELCKKGNIKITLQILSLGGDLRISIVPIYSCDPQLLHLINLSSQTLFGFRLVAKNSI